MNLLCCSNMARNQKVTKKWEIFAGRNKFYCDGYLMTAPNSGVFYFTVILITGTSGLFFAFDCPYLAKNITPAIPVVGVILFVFTMSSLFRTSFSDPGIIPRASQDEAAYIEKQIEVPNSLNSPTYRPPPRTKEIFVKGQTVKLKYCFTCKIFRPPRASHCSLCDNCVDRFDHHCPWVGNCVGKRNYRFFYMFIISLAFLTVFIFTCTTTHFIMLLPEKQFLEVVKKNPFIVIIDIICFCSVWSVIGLAGFHTYLTTSDQTTNEDIKGSFTSKGGQQVINPYSQGNICLNCFHILCGPFTPSLIDRRGAVTDEYRTQMQAQDSRYNSVNVPPLVVMQPSGTGMAIDNVNKSYNTDIESQNPNTGIYRQRSYDNLQTEKSNSIAHLVENEMPLSTSGNFADDSNLTAITIDDVSNMEENLSKLNNLSGSYNNLFRESSVNMSSTGVSNDINDIVACNDTSNENVYSNITSNNNLVKNNNSKNVVDENIHVYSNINNSSSSFVAPTLPTLASSTPITSKNRKKISTSISSTMINDSNLLNDLDLDLDDPVMISSFKNNSQIIGSKMSSNSVVKEPKLYLNKNPQQIAAVEMKNVIKTLDANTINAVNSPILPQNNSSSSAFISNLKHLQESTMIDTALDLDSLELDGSSIGNNSQSCLVKTAIV